MKKKHTLINAALFSLVGAISPVNAADTIIGYTSTLLELDDSDARAKKIRLIYSLDNVWNQSLLPEGAKEVRLVLNGGSGFDMTNVPSKKRIYGFPFGADYRYSVPTAFKLGVSYIDGAPLRHMSHAPENTIASASVSESLEFNLGITASQSSSITAGISKSTRVSYEQAEFETVADFSQTNESISWEIENRTIRHHSPAKEWLIHTWTSCDMGNLIPISSLPVVMRSDFKPNVGVVYRKNNLSDGQDITRVNLQAGWRLSNYYFGRDWCSWHIDPQNTWKKNKDSSTWTETSRSVAISWSDELYD